MHRSPLSFIKSVVNELLIEEIHLQSYSEKDIISIFNHYMLVVLFKSLSNNQNKHYPRVTFNKFSFCKQKGHCKAQCPKLR